MKKEDPVKTPRPGLVRRFVSFLLVGILAVACDRKCMYGQPSSIPGRVAVGIAALLMFAAAAGMFLF
jgi:hypothetical protein